MKTGVLSMIGKVLQDFRVQHKIDLAVYRSAHGHVWNRRLHYVLIPLEVASFLWISTTLLMTLRKGRWWGGNSKESKASSFLTVDHRVFILATAWTLGLVSGCVAENPVLGLTVLILHVFMGHICLVWACTMDFRKSMTIGLVVWMLSWSLQIGVGHYYIEGKPPNLFNPTDKVSLLSTITSIVLAWEC